MELHQTMQVVLHPAVCVDYTININVVVSALSRCSDSHS